METFWMVWNPENRLPRVKHCHERLAVVEAERLARENVGQSFFVLKAESVSRVEPPTITRKLEEATPF